MTACTWQPPDPHHLLVLIRFDWSQGSAHRCNSVSFPPLIQNNSYFLCRHTHGRSEDNMNPNLMDLSSGILKPQATCSLYAAKPRSDTSASLVFFLFFFLKFMGNYVFLGFSLNLVAVGKKRHGWNPATQRLSEQLRIRIEGGVLCLSWCMWMKQDCKSRSEIRSNQSCLTERTHKMTFSFHSCLENMKTLKAELSLDASRTEKQDEE